MSAKMPEWPKLGVYAGYRDNGETYFAVHSEATAYERAMKEAYAARLKVAVEALASVGSSLGCKYGDNVVSIRELLDIIGPLPEATGR